MYEPSKKAKAKLKKAIKNYNAKIDRILARTPEMIEILPEKVTYSKYREKLQRPADLRVAIHNLRAFSKKGAERLYTTKQGVNITVWEKQKIDRDFRRLNARRRQMMNKYRPSTYTGTMGAIEEFELKPRVNDVERIEPRKWRSFVEKLEKQLANTSYDRYKSNYLKAIENVFGKGKLYDKVNSISPELLTRLFYTNPYMQIGFVYDKFQEEDTREQAITEAIEQATSQSMQKALPE